MSDKATRFWGDRSDFVRPIYKLGVSKPKTRMKNNTKINPEETLLVGSWNMDNGKVVADKVCQRIEKLMANYLRKVAEGNWETLYQDPKDNRYWLLNYPHSGWHGGGPPSLEMITQTEVTQKFGLLK